MILAFVTDPFLRAVVRRAALPDEDVYWTPADVQEAVRRGFPRLGVRALHDPHPLGDPRKVIGTSVPLLTLAPATLEAWRDSHRLVGFAVRRVDDHGRRLRSLMADAAGSGSGRWVNALFRDLTAAAGRSLPGSLRGMGRRILEFPSRYTDLHAMAELSGISRGALKARFRRRGLPSPYTYLRWFRVLAAVHVLEDGEPTTEEAAYRVGLHSSGNFCRYVQEVSGCTPTELRQPVARIRTLTGFVEECLGPSELEAWEGLHDLFLADVA